MGHRFLFGPITTEFAEPNQRHPPPRGDILTFGFSGPADIPVAAADSWEQVCARFPQGWKPDGIILYCPYATIPPFAWTAPVPLIGWASDWNLLWHNYRHALPRCDFVLTDGPGAETLSRHGLAHVYAANLAGCQPRFLEQLYPDGPRDIDLLFVGNVHPAVQRERLPWLARVARLAEHWKVQIHTGVFGAAYRALLGRARIVFNRSNRGECNRRVFEAVAAGAVLFQEAENKETHAYFRDRQECVYYAADNLEELLEHYLRHEDERLALAAAARARLGEHSFEALWGKITGLLEENWDQIEQRSRRRLPWDKTEFLLARCGQALSSTHRADPRLVHDLSLAAAQERRADLYNALGLAIALAGTGPGPLARSVVETACEHFRQALDIEPSDVMAGLNLTEALAELGKKQAASQQARRTLAVLDQQTGTEAPPGDGGHYPPAFDFFRVEWERAACTHPDRPAEEAAAKRDLMRWRLHLLLGELTDDLNQRALAVQIRPDLPTTRAALGCALGRARRPGEAIEHLRCAVAASPFDAVAARALFQALGDAGDRPAQLLLAHERRLLCRAAPQLVAPESWFATRSDIPVEQAPGKEPTRAPRGLTPPGRPRISLCMIVKNEEANLGSCLESVKDLFDETIIVDTGSTDQTKAIASRFQARVYDFAWVDHFAAARNESLRRATGDWIFWLDADDRLDEANHGKLHGLLQNLPETNIAFVMKCLCLPDGVTGATSVVDHVRLFRNHPQVRWQYRVHEQILLAIRSTGGEVRWADVVIQHTGYQDPGQRGLKLERDLRLLHLENAEHPDDPFTLFNLGWTFCELRRPAQALPLLQQSLSRSLPHDSIVRKLFVLIARCQCQLGQAGEALAVCRRGRTYYPTDAELLFEEGRLLGQQGNLAGAEACLVQLLEGQGGAHFASLDPGLRGYWARHQLALIYQQQKRFAEAEQQWQAALAERADFGPAWLGLGDIYLAQGRWQELEAVAGRLGGDASGAMEAAVLRARGHLARADFAAALKILEETTARHPRALRPRVVFSLALLQERRDLVAAEAALRDVLMLDPGHASTLHNLKVLLHEQGRSLENRLR
jgi:tetratricopeptide (TPR) repeat protein